MKEKIEIPLSKNKIYKLIFGSLVFVIIGCWIVFNPNYFVDIPSKFLGNTTVIKSIGTISILFFGLTGFIGLKKLFDKKSGLIIDENGITDHSSATSVGLIEWNDISEIKIKRILSTKHLLIEVKNPAKYIETEKNSLKAKLLQSNRRISGTPISITSNTLKCDFSELKKLIETEFEKYKNAS